ncbi:3-(3-hydroxyphenyl)propionate hydroxylase [Actinomadura darangshiensis]|uniref:3-(3-hydroxyphenyl)propionate hydroxylase n=1 Tax=Actinomadura darangshiensis TaxID=705336 RepID=A0A4R5B1Z5_9ACTN|nr:FAD-dependent monooxygenase [Actinomadura darangshiensis]TDD80098.1 3-(3-hydroxyphenyl)propionate hydroxylase [Actinomadura darangshiensis]
MTDVLIIGAGPTGLALAVDLARRGVGHRIIDPGIPTGSRGKGLQPRTLEVFDDLGVIGPILETGAAYPPIRAYSGTDVVWEGRMSEPKEPSAAVPYPNVLMVPQWRTEQILRDRLMELGGRVDRGELAGFTKDAEGVTATLADGTTIHAAYLVGADGGRSAVRKTLGIAFEGETREEERMLIGDVQTTDLDRDHWHTWADMEKQTVRVGLVPLPGTDDFQFTAPIQPGDDPELTLATYQKVLEAGTDRTDIRLTGLTWSSIYRVNIRMAERFRDGRVFLAGDAAHVHSPAGGQGLNTGVQDAYNLGWKLAVVLKGGPSTLLDTYEEERLPVAAGVLGISTRLYQKAVEGQADAHERGEETQQLLLAYPDSSLSAGPLGGTRVADAVLRDKTGAEIRLHDLLRGPHSTVLAFDVPADIDHPDVRVVTIGESGDYIDPDGQVRSALQGAAMALIRPDGYIARTGDASAVQGHLARMTRAN